MWLSQHTSSSRRKRTGLSCKAILAKQHRYEGCYHTIQKNVASGSNTFTILFQPYFLDTSRQNKQNLSFLLREPYILQGIILHSLYTAFYLFNYLYNYQLSVTIHSYL